MIRIIRLLRLYRQLEEAMDKLMKSVSSSWKTTVAGIALAVSQLANAVNMLFDGNPDTNPDWNAVILAVIAAIGLFAARDSDKSSEDSGINV